MTTSKTQAALLSVGAAFFLLIIKFIVAWLTDSLGIFAEAMNSALDIVASGVTLAAVAFADRPADDTHHYGHGKAESLGALTQTIILLITCGGIAWEAIQRLLNPTETVTPTFWAFAVMVISVVISVWRVWDIRRTTAITPSQALEADALHFASDIYTGGAVLIGLAGVLLGEQFGIGWLGQSDAMAALVVVVILARLTLHNGREALDVLLDRASHQTDDIRALAEGIAGVQRVHTVRTRQVGAQTFVELHIDVARTKPFEESHAIATAVEDTISHYLPRSDVIVHVDPVQGDNEGAVEQIHTLAQRHGVAVHHISLHRVGGQRIAHLHLELPATLSLAEAHDRADAFEQIVVDEVEALDEVVSHLEPIFEDEAVATDVTPKAAELVAVVKRLAEEVSGIRGVHDIQVQQLGKREYAVSLHCTFDENALLSTVHARMATLERRMREQIPGLHHVMVHPEPDSISLVEKS
jgi:cation diffusion facilitator family transporter